MILVVRDLLQILRTGHAPIHHDGGPRFRAHPFLQGGQHLIHGRPIRPIPVKHLMGLGKPFASQHQPDHHLLTV